jgi:probable rRNA maturation factor
MLVDTVIEDDRWAEFDLPARAETAARATLAAAGLRPEGFVLCLMGCDDAAIADLNAEFRGKPSPTNVLSWPAEERRPAQAGAAPRLPRPGRAEMPCELGDIAIAYDTCAREAAEQAKPFADHVTHLVAHGVLHLLGYDHETEADAALMEGLERRALATLGVSDPY